MPLTVSIITPERALPSVQAEHCTVSLADGQAGLRPGHASLVGLLAPGQVMIRSGGREVSYAVRGGVCQIHRDEVSILAETVLTYERIDHKAVQARLDGLHANPQDAAARSEMAWCKAQLGLPKPATSAQDYVSGAHIASRAVNMPH